MIGKYTEFYYRRPVLSRKTGKPCGILGYIGKNENCILHISQIMNRKVTEDEFSKVIEKSKKENIKIQLIDHTEKGWQGSLKSQNLNLEDQ